MFLGWPAAPKKGASRALATPDWCWLQPSPANSSQFQPRKGSNCAKGGSQWGRAALRSWESELRGTFRWSSVTGVTGERGISHGHSGFGAVACNDRHIFYNGCREERQPLTSGASLARNSSHKCQLTQVPRSSGRRALPWGHHRPGLPQAGQAKVQSRTQTSGFAHLINVIVVTPARFLHKNWASLFTFFFFLVMRGCVGGWLSASLLVFKFSLKDVINWSQENLNQLPHRAVQHGSREATRITRSGLFFAGDRPGSGEVNE